MILKVLTPMDLRGHVLSPPSSPTTPSSGIEEFCQKLAGRPFPAFTNPDGATVCLQPSLFGSSVLQWLPGNGSTLSIAYGDTWTALNSGSGAGQTHPTRNTNNLFSYLRRAMFSTGTTAAGSSGIRSTAITTFRGYGTLGGFFYYTRFGVEAYGSCRLFNGLSGTTTALAGEPSARASSIGIGKGASDSMWSIVSNDGSNGQSVSTGQSVITGQPLDFMMYAAPGSNKVTVRLVSAETQAVLVNDLEVTARLPVNTTGLYAQHLIQSTSGTTAKSFSLCSLYVETNR